MAVPPGVPADGSLRVGFITTFAGTLAVAGMSAEKDFSCYLTADGLNRTYNEAAATDDRLCTTQSGEDPGRYSEGLELKYVFDQQNTTPTENLAYVTLKRGVKGFLVVRYGVAFDQAWASGDVVDVIAFTAGVQQKNTPAPNEKLKVSQKLFIPAGGVTTDLVIAA